MNSQNNWGSILGESHNVLAYSNIGVKYNYNNWKSYQNILKKEEYNLPTDIISGIKYQCVEFARRYLILTYGVTFQEIKNAEDIIKLEKVQDLNNKNTFYEFKTYLQNGNEQPKIGDLLISKKSIKQPYGHVCVIVEVGPNFICVAEQNYEENIWRSQHYSRKLKVNTINGHYQITLIRIGEEYKIKYWWDRNETILGWKRIIK